MSVMKPTCTQSFFLSVFRHITNPSYMFDTISCRYNFFFNFQRKFTNPVPQNCPPGGNFQTFLELIQPVIYFYIQLNYLPQFLLIIYDNLIKPRKCKWREQKLSQQFIKFNCIPSGELLFSISFSGN